MRYFENDEGIVLGSILDTSSIPHPLEVHPGTIKVSEISAAIEKESKRALDLSKGTIFSACFYAIDDGSSMLAITLHHAAAGECFPLKFYCIKNHQNSNLIIVLYFILFLI